MWCYKHQVFNKLSLKCSWVIRITLIILRSYLSVEYPWEMLPSRYHTPILLVLAPLLVIYLCLCIASIQINFNTVVVITLICCFVIILQFYIQTTISDWLDFQIAIMLSCAWDLRTRTPIASPLRMISCVGIPSYIYSLIVKITSSTRLWRLIIYLRIRISYTEYFFGKLNFLYV